jgi:hypothetical protein
MDETLRDILSKAICAPSGDNCQPWSIRIIRADQLELWNVPNRDTSLYNFNNNASYLSHGAFLENLSIAAEHHGFSADITLFPEESNTDLVARINLKKAEGNHGNEDSYLAIDKRATTRKPYEAHPLPMDIANLLRTSAGIQPAAAMKLVTDTETIKKLAHLAAKNEEILFGNQTMHHFFFDHVTWSSEAAAQKRTGFFVDTLELPPPAKLLFPLWKHWSIMRIFAALGFTKLVSNDNGALYAKSGGIGVITISAIGAKEYVEAGRLLERVWLAATHLGLRLQPLTGIPFLYHRISHGMADAFTVRERSIIDGAYQGIITTLGLPESSRVALMFRVGKGDEPSARSLRFRLEDFIES